MTPTEQPMTEALGLTLQEYDDYRPLSVEHIRDEMLGQWNHEATDEEVIKVIDYIDEHVWMFLYDAIESVLSPRKPCPNCNQPKPEATASAETPHP